MPAASRAQLERWRAEIHALAQRDAAPDYADPAAFAREALGLDLDDWQTDVLAGDWTRLLMNACRQAGKSTTAAALALYEAVYRPGSLTLLVSPSLRQSSELFRKVLEFRQQLAWRVPLAEDNRLSMRVHGGGRIVSLPGSERTIRGHSSVTLLIEDESTRVDDALYLAVRPMLAVSRGRQALLSTPNGQRGHFYDAWTDGSGWKRVRVPATECPRITPEFLEEERSAMGARWFAQEYLCEFEAAEDAVFRREEIDRAFTSDVQPLWSPA